MDIFEVPEVPEVPLVVALPQLADFERIRTHCFSDLASTPDELRKVILQLGQRQLQDRFRKVYQRATWSNNNTWLRRRLLEATGLQAPKQVARARSTSSRPLGAAGAHRPRPRPHAQASEVVALFGGSGVRRTARPPKPKVLEDAADYPGGGRYGTASGRIPSVGRAGSRSAARSAPRPIPRTSESLALEITRASQSRMLQYPGGSSAPRTPNFSDGDDTENDLDDDSALISTSSVFDGSISPEAFLTQGRGAYSDGETGSEGAGGYDVRGMWTRGHDQEYETRSQPASFVSTQGSYDFHSFTGHPGRGMHGRHYGQQHLMLQSREPGAGSVPLLQKPREESFSMSAPSPYAAHFPGMPSLPGFAAGSYQPIMVPEMLQHPSLSSASTDAPIPYDKWHSIASADALRLGAGLGNIRISQSPVRERSGREGPPPLTPSSARKRKSGEMSPELGSGFAGRWVGAAMMHKPHMETPDMSPASIVGFSSGANFEFGLAASSIASQASQQLESNRSLPHVSTTAGEAAATQQWHVLDEMMQCETPSERRMLDISSMRVS